MRGAVWGLGEDSAGMSIRFVTDATAISARWTLRRERLAMPHMPASGVSGLDLYVKAGAKWQWLGGGRPGQVSDGREEAGREHETGPARVSALSAALQRSRGIGNRRSRSDAKLEPAPRRPDGLKPIVFYGTSIVQGGCASRPGMAYPAILGRRLGREQINLGFSGNAWSEPEVAQLLAELDPAVYVLDPLPNMKEEWVAPRLEQFVAILRAAHPTTPIVLVENVPIPTGILWGCGASVTQKANARLRELYHRLVRAGDKKLLYVPAEGLLGADTEGTVDGTHPTDLGFLRMADAIEPALRARCTEAASLLEASVAGPTGREALF